MPQLLFRHKSTHLAFFFISARVKDRQDYREFFVTDFVFGLGFVGFFKSLMSFLLCIKKLADLEFVDKRWQLAVLSYSLSDCNASFVELEINSVSSFPTLSLITWRCESLVLPDLFSLGELRGTTKNPSVSFQVTFHWIDLVDFSLEMCFKATNGLLWEFLLLLLTFKFELPV